MEQIIEAANKDAMLTKQQEILTMAAERFLLHSV